MSEIQDHNADKNVDVTGSIKRSALGVNKITNNMNNKNKNSDTIASRRLVLLFMFLTIPLPLFLEAHTRRVSLRR